MRISDRSSDVCSSDLRPTVGGGKREKIEPNPCSLSLDLEDQRILASWLEQSKTIGCQRQAPFGTIHIIGFLDFGEDVGHLAPTVSEECLGVLLAATAKRLHEPQQELSGDGNIDHFGNLVLTNESSAGERKVQK